MRIRGMTVRTLAAGVVAAIVFMVSTPPAQADHRDGERVAGAIVGSVIGGAIGSTVGRGSDRALAIGVGSLIGSIAGYHVVHPTPPRHYRHGHVRARHHRTRVHYDYPVLQPQVHVSPRRERHVHHHYYEAPQPQPVVTYQLPAPVMNTDTGQQVNIVTAPPRGRASWNHNATLTACKVLEGGIAPVYACRTADGNWQLLK